LTVGQKKSIDFNDFRWMLSAIAMIASLYSVLDQRSESAADKPESSQKNEAEKYYIKYVSLVE
jgi:hypothetical protein